MSQAGIINVAGGGGGGSPIEAINVQTGITPVVPTLNKITFNGSVVAAGTNPLPVYTDGTALSTMDLEVQISSTNPTSLASKNGLSHFDSTTFTVDGNGFVSLNGASVGETITGDSGGALSPTSGNWNILGRSGSKTSGAGSTLTINSPPYSQVGASGTSVLNSGEFVTAAITRTLPLTAGLLDGDLVEFVCTPSGSLVITANTGQTIRIGSLVSSSGGTCTSTLTGNSVSLRFNTITTSWFATSVIGTWILS